MRYSDNYELNLVEGSDIVNPLVQDVPNYETIDEAMYDNKVHSVGVATELRTGTVHALTRLNEDAAVFRFTATSNYTVGDTFTVDGVQVTALLVDGTHLPDGAYIIGSEVLVTLKGTLMTVYANRTTASDSDKLGGELPAYYATASDITTLEGTISAQANLINNLKTRLDNAGKLTGVGTITENYSTWDKSLYDYNEYCIIVILTNGMRLVEYLPASMISSNEIAIPLSIFYNSNYHAMINVAISDTQKKCTVTSTGYTVDRVNLYGVN